MSLGELNIERRDREKIPLCSLPAMVWDLEPKVLPRVCPSLLLILILVDQRRGIFNISFNFSEIGECPGKACGCRITEYSIISEFSGNKHKHTQLPMSGVGGKVHSESLTLLFTLIPCFYTLLYRNPVFPFMFFDVGMDFLPCLEHGEEMPLCKVPVKILHANTAGFGSLLAVFSLLSVHFAGFKHKLKAHSLMRVAQGSSCFAPVSVLL